MDELVRDDGLSLPRPMEYVRSEIQVLAVNMERRLREKEIDPDKCDDSWKEMSVPDLADDLSPQVDMLLKAIEYILTETLENDPNLIKKKCADIANYCMFIHDNVGK